MNVTINTRNLSEEIFDDIFSQFENIDNEIAAENNDQEIEEFTSFMVSEMKKDLNPPKTNKNGYKWFDVETGKYHSFINNNEGSILTLTKDQFINSNLPDRTKEMNF